MQLKRPKIAIFLEINQARLLAFHKELKHLVKKKPGGNSLQILAFGSLWLHSAYEFSNFYLKIALFPCYNSPGRVIGIH